jgi:hypothetical protein
MKLIYVEPAPLMLCSVSAGRKFVSTSYVCLYAGMYVCIYVSYVCMYIYMYVCMYIYIYIYIHRMSRGSISSNFSQVESKSAKVGQTGGGTDVGLESGNSAVELASHKANTHLPDLLPPLLIYIYIIYIYIYIYNIYIYIYI